MLKEYEVGNNAIWVNLLQFANDLFLYINLRLTISW